MQSLQSENYVLVIGVNDYSKLDRSRKVPVGTHALRGCLIDVKTHLQILRDRGVPGKRVRVLAAPAIDPGLLGVRGARIDGAPTGSAIRAGVKWLLKEVRKSANRSGTIIFAGAGAHDRRGRLLCGSDVTDGLAEAVPLSELLRMAERAAVAEDRLLWFLDCAFAPREVANGRLRCHSEAPLPDNVGALSVFTGGSNATGVERFLTGEWRGLATRALARHLGSIDLDWEFHAGNNGFTTLDPVTGATLGYVLVPASDFPDGTYLAGNEYWFWVNGAPFPNRFELAMRNTPIPKSVLQGPFEQQIHGYFDKNQGMPFQGINLGTGDKLYRIDVRKSGVTKRAGFVHRRPSGQMNWFGDQGGLDFMGNQGLIASNAQIRFEVDNQPSNFTFLPLIPF